MHEDGGQSLKLHSLDNWTNSQQGKNMAWAKFEVDWAGGAAHVVP